ncbi:hypothetical protein [Paracoccus sp. (in: a-proteobacteria)]|uniref:hypothetical protein n=1 Tax=Paracoccus sp. TaxID=267 RepID=UPI00396C575B
MFREQASQVRVPNPLPAACTVPARRLETRSLRQAVEALAFEGILHPVRGGWTIGGLPILAPHRVQATHHVRLLVDPVTKG